MSAIWTDKDTKTCDFFAQQPDSKVKEPPVKKVKAPRVPKPIQESKARVIVDADYSQRVELCKVVVKALEIVTATLGYNLVDSNSNEARKHRRDGWHTFCLLVKLMCNSTYTVQQVATAVTVPNKPCKEVFIGMFEHCRESPHSEKELKVLISQIRK